MLKKHRGGKRINAGRKPEGDAALKATIIARVTADQKRVFQEKGGGKWLRQTLTTSDSITKNSSVGIKAVHPHSKISQKFQCLSLNILCRQAFRRRRKVTRKRLTLMNCWLITNRQPLF